MSIDEEKERLRGLLTHDAEAVEAIYRENFRMIQALVVKNNGSFEDARDIFQESLIVLFQNAQSSSFELNCSIGTYLYAVAKRIWLKRLGKSKMLVVTRDYDAEEAVDVSEDVEIHESEDKKLRVMEEAMKLLGEPCKSLLESFYIQKKSMTEIADRFGYTNSDNAKTQKYKCLSRLKKIYFSHYKND